MKLTKIALGVALVAGTVAAQAADPIWFPHVVVSGTVTTIATVINDGASAGSQHWIYAGKNMALGQDVDLFNAEPCSEVDYDVPTSDNNVQSADLGAIISKAGDYGVIFNDPSVKNNWRAGVDFSNPYSIADQYRAGAFATRGYLAVQEDAATGTLAGYALVFDYKTGSAWGYTAEPLTDTQMAEHNFTPFGAHLMPKNEVISRLMVTPTTDTAADMLPISAGGTANFGNLSVILTADVIGTGNVVNRDEKPISGAAVKAVTCVGTVDMYDLISPGAQKSVPDGGWIKVMSNAGPAGIETGAVIYQLDFGGEGATQKTLNGMPYTGGWNNLMVVQ